MISGGPGAPAQARVRAVDYGLPARDQWLWNDRTPETLRSVVLRWLWITAVFALVALAPALIPGQHSLWARMRLWTHEYDWSREWAFLGPSFSLCRVAWIIALVAGACVLWRRTSSLFRVVTIACALRILCAVSSSLTTYRILSMEQCSHWAWVGSGFWRAGDMALPVYVLWFSHRGAAARAQAMKLVAAYLVICGLSSGLGNLALAFQLGTFRFAARVPLSDVGKWADWAWRTLWPAVPPLAYAACGLWLLLRRHKPLARIACVLLVVSILSAGSHWALSWRVAHRYPQYPPPPWFSVVSEQVGYAYEPALALAFALLVLRHRRGGSPDDPVCASCGYSLRGVPRDGHRCPECGAAFRLPDDRP